MTVLDRARTMIATATDHTRHLAHREAQAYRQGQDRPLAGYLAAIATYGLSVGALGATGALAGARLPETVSPWDVTLLGIATQRISRTLAKDTVTAPLRAPFTTFEASEGQAELAEQVRGTGVRHAVGELITCPFCLAQWVATGLAGGLVFAPRATRLVAATMSAVAISDVLQNVYALVQQKATGSGAYAAEHDVAVHLEPSEDGTTEGNPQQPADQGGRPSQRRKSPPAVATSSLLTFGRWDHRASPARCLRRRHTHGK